jgi:hypothetical protein
MTTTGNKETEVVMTSEQIALKYYEHNLTMIQEHIESNVIADCKKEEMALMINTLEHLFKNYTKKIKNIHDDKVLESCYAIDKIWKLELIEMIVKF